jgi:hypothetical protein
MGAVERLLKGLPGIRGYVDKELRREADRRLRTMLASQLAEQRSSLVNIQQQMLKRGGLKNLDRVDGAVRNLQTLIDRVQTANQGYSGIFDAARIGEEQLAALHRFDVALAERTEELGDGLNELAAAVRAGDAVDQALSRVTTTIDELNTLFQRRDRALVDPDLLMDTGYAPQVDERLLNVETDETSGE